MKKITKTTFKSFCNKNKDNLYIIVESWFDGMVDCVMAVDDPQKTKVLLVDFDEYYCLATRYDGRNRGGISLTGRDYFTEIENGFEVSNCVGSFKVITG